VEKFGAVKVSNAWAEDAMIDLEPWERIVAARKWFRKVRYDEHLSSDKWRAIRERAIARAGGLCERCHSPAGHVHHVTYANFGSEKDEDLEVLCPPCHWREHGRIF
jgi:5-methylcytosine-specific restriction endonuclease McrA